jgi:hypothetical protein
MLIGMKRRPSSRAVASAVCVCFLTSITTPSLAQTRKRPSTTGTSAPRPRPPSPPRGAEVAGTYEMTVNGQPLRLHLFPALTGVVTYTNGGYRTPLGKIGWVPTMRLLSFRRDLMRGGLYQWFECRVENRSCQGKFSEGQHRARPTASEFRHTFSIRPERPAAPPSVRPGLVAPAPPRPPKAMTVVATDPARSYTEEAKSETERIKVQKALYGESAFTVCMNRASSIRPFFPSNLTAAFNFFSEKTLRPGCAGMPPKASLLDVCKMPRKCKDYVDKGKKGTLCWHEIDPSWKCKFGKTMGDFWYSSNSLTSLCGMLYSCGVNAQPKDVTDRIGAVCDGKKRCDYVFYWKKLGLPRPDPNVPKDLVVKYTCGADPEVLEAREPEEAAWRRTVSLRCPERFVAHLAGYFKVANGGNGFPSGKCDLKQLLLKMDPLEHLRAQCDGKPTCQYLPQPSTSADCPFYWAAWRCGADGNGGGQTVKADGKERIVAACGAGSSPTLTDAIIDAKERWRDSLSLHLQADKLGPVTDITGLGTPVPLSKVKEDYAKAVKDGKAAPGEKEPTELTTGELQAYRGLLPDMNRYVSYIKDKALKLKAVNRSLQDKALGDKPGEHRDNLVDILSQYGCRQISRALPGFARITKILVAAEPEQDPEDTESPPPDVNKIQCADVDDAEQHKSDCTKDNSPPPNDLKPEPIEVEVCTVTHAQLAATLRADMGKIIDRRGANQGGSVDEFPPIQPISEDRSFPAKVPMGPELARNDALPVRDADYIFIARRLLGFFRKRGNLRVFSTAMEKHSGNVHKMAEAKGGTPDTFKEELPHHQGSAIDIRNNRELLRRAVDQWTDGYEYEEMRDLLKKGVTFEDEPIADDYRPKEGKHWEVFWNDCKELRNLCQAPSKNASHRREREMCIQCAELAVKNACIEGTTQDTDSRHALINEKEIGSWDQKDVKRIRVTCDPRSFIVPGSVKATFGQNIKAPEGNWTGTLQSRKKVWNDAAWDYDLPMSARGNPKEKNFVVDWDCKQKPGQTPMCKGRTHMSNYDNYAESLKYETNMDQHTDHSDVYAKGQDKNPDPPGNTFLNWLKIKFAAEIHNAEYHKGQHVLERPYYTREIPKWVAITKFLGAGSNSNKITGEGKKYLDALPITAWQRCYLWSTPAQFNHGDCDRLDANQPAPSPKDAVAALRAARNDPTWGQRPLFRMVLASPFVQAWISNLIQFCTNWNNDRGGCNAQTNQGLNNIDRRFDELLSEVSKDIQDDGNDTNEQAGNAAGDVIGEVIGKILGMLINAAGMSDMMKTLGQAAGLTPEQSADCEDPEYRRETMKLPKAQNHKRGCLLKVFAKNFVTILENIIVMLGNKLVDWAVDLVRNALQGVKSSLLASAGSVPFAGGSLATLVDILWELLFNFGLKMLLKNLVIAKLPIDKLTDHPIVSVILGMILEIIDAAVQTGKQSFLAAGFDVLLTVIQQVLVSQKQYFWVRAIAFAKKEMARDGPKQGIGDQIRALLSGMIGGFGEAIERKLDYRFKSDFHRAIQNVRDFVNTVSLGEVMSSLKGDPVKYIVGLVADKLVPVIIPIVVAFVPGIPEWVKDMLAVIAREIHRVPEIINDKSKLGDLLQIGVAILRPLVKPLLGAASFGNDTLKKFIELALDKVLAAIEQPQEIQNALKEPRIIVAGLLGAARPFLVDRVGKFFNQANLVLEGEILVQRGLDWILKVWGVDATASGADPEKVVEALASALGSYLRVRASAVAQGTGLEKTVSLLLDALLGNEGLPADQILGGMRARVESAGAQIVAEAKSALAGIVEAAKAAAAASGKVLGNLVQQAIGKLAEAIEKGGGVNAIVGSAVPTRDAIGKLLRLLGEFLRDKVVSLVPAKLEGIRKIVADLYDGLVAAAAKLVAGTASAPGAKDLAAAVLGWLGRPLKEAAVSALGAGKSYEPVRQLLGATIDGVLGLVADPQKLKLAFTNADAALQTFLPLLYRLFNPFFQALVQRVNGVGGKILGWIIDAAMGVLKDENGVASLKQFVANKDVGAFAKNALKGFIGSMIGNISNDTLKGLVDQLIAVALDKFIFGK